ncbi:MAG: outer membrane beta-barrel protein [Candidatus Korobacteraceae bacterium]
MKKSICLCVFMALVTLGAAAQTEYPKVELAGGYSYVNLNPQIASSQNFNGGGGAFVYNFSSIFGIKADFMGYTGGTGWNNYLRQHGYGDVNISGNAFTYMFGPQIKKHSGKFQPFGEGLFGAAHSNGYGTLIGCIENQGCGTKNAYGSNNGFAMEFGGGLDIPLSSHIQIRPVEVDYLLTHFGSNHIAGYSSTQNNFKYFGGINFTLGGGGN